MLSAPDQPEDWWPILSDLVFSIAVPIGSYHPVLRTTLESLRVQGEGVRVAVLDASGDPRVAAILDEYASLIQYRRDGKDAGQAAAIAEGWREVEGDVLGWLNADDFLYPGAIAAARRVFDMEPDIDVVTGDTVFIDEAGRFTGFHPGIGTPDERLLTSNPISQPSTFVRRSAVEKIGGISTSLHYTMDWDLWVRLYKADCAFARDSGCLSGVRIERGTKTMRFDRARRREVLKLIAPHASVTRKLKVMTGFWLQYIDDRTGLVSRMLDRMHSRAPASGDSDRLVSQRAFTRSARMPLIHFGTGAGARLDIQCEGGPYLAEIFTHDSHAEVLSGSEGDASIDTNMAPSETGWLKVTPASDQPVRLLSVAIVGA